MSYIKKSDRQPIPIPEKQVDEVKQIKQELSKPESRYVAVYYDASPALIKLRDNESGKEMEVMEVLAEILNKLES